MSYAVHERTPLLNHAAHQSAEGYADQLAGESAFSSSLDPNASAFGPPSQFLSVVDEETGEAHVSGVPAPVEAAPKWDVYITLSGMWIGTFLAALDGTIVATILSTIGSEFSVSNEISWLGTSYLLTQCAFQPLYGKLSDIFGRKAATLFASVIFLLGSLGCGLSTSFPMLITMRAIAGIGGGGLTTMASIVTSDLVSLRDRGTYQGLGNVVYAFGAAIGGPLGGLMGDTIGWKWAFLMQVPLCFIHFGVVAWKVNIPVAPGDIVSRLKRIDYFGAVTLVGGMGLFLVGTSLGGNQYPWSHPLVYGAMIAAIVMIGAFVLVERYVAREPLMPMSILFARTPGCVSLTNWFISMSQFGILFNVPLYFSAVEQNSTSYSGLHLIPNAVLASTASLLCGMYMKRYGFYRTLSIVMGFLGVLGPLMMFGWDRHRPHVLNEIFYWFSMGPGGIGYGGILTVTLVVLIAAVPQENMAAATGISYLFRATGSALGISLSTALLQNNLARELPKVITGKHAAKIIENIRLDVGYIHKLHGSVREGAIEAYQYSMRWVFALMTVQALLAFIAICFIGTHELPKSLDRKK